MAHNKTAVALGLFDGVHNGHRAVISKAAAMAEKGFIPAVFTFRCETLAVKQGRSIQYIYSDSFKEKLISINGIPQELIDIVLEKAKHLLSKPIDWVDRQDELYYALKVASRGDIGFLKSVIFDPTLEKSSFLSRKLRTYYLVKLHVLRFREAFKKHWHFFYLKMISTRIDLLDYYLDRV